MVVLGIAARIVSEVLSETVGHITIVVLGIAARIYQKYCQKQLVI